MKKAAWTNKRGGGILATVLLGAGLVVSARFADADTGAAGTGGNLAQLLETKLDGSRGGVPATPRTVSTAMPADPRAPIDAAARMALIGLGVAAAVFAVALGLKRMREARMGDLLGSNLSVKESVWIGRGQRILLVAFENHKVLVGVSGGALHNLGMIGEGGEAVLPENPIERAAALRDAEDKKTSEFSDFVKGELAGSIGAATGGGRDRRRRMITELNTL